ncbi:hypothetical protein MRX96_038491 [Rhipicephalus microplus]
MSHPATSPKLQSSICQSITDEYEKQHVGAHEEASEPPLVRQPAKTLDSAKVPRYVHTVESSNAKTCADAALQCGAITPLRSGDAASSGSELRLYGSQARRVAADLPSHPGAQTYKRATWEHRLASAAVTRLKRAGCAPLKRRPRRGPPPRNTGRLQESRPRCEGRQAASHSGKADPRHRAKQRVNGDAGRNIDAPNAGGL